MKNNNMLSIAGLSLVLVLAGCAGTKDLAPPPAPEPTPAPAPEPKTYIIEGVHFAFDSAQLNSSASATLDQVAAELRNQSAVSYEIGGHTDSVGSNAYNQDLSERRASSVYSYLVGAGVAAGQLTTRGYGETQPVASNDTAEGRAENRRVEIRPIQ